MPLDKLLGDLLSAPTSGKLTIDSFGGIGGLLKHGKKAKKFMRKNAIGIGGTAALAGAGMLAYRQWQESQQQPQPGKKSTTSAPPLLPGQQTAASIPPPLPSELSSVADLPVGQEADALALKLVKAMIGAAHADGNIDPVELDAILAAMDDSELTPAEKAELTAAMNQIPTVEEIAALADSEEEKAELYAASLAAIDDDTPAESLYLKRLARALALPRGVIDAIHSAPAE